MMFYILLTLILLVFITLAVYCWWLIAWIIGGINVMPTTRRAAGAVVLLVKKYGQKNGIFCDLGCAQGMVARQVKKAMPEMEIIGVEKSPNQYLIGRIKNIFSARPIKILRQDLFDADVSGADVIYLYLPRPLLPRLEEKLEREAKTGAIVITNTVSFADWLPIETRVVHSDSPNFEKMFLD